VRRDIMPRSVWTGALRFGLVTIPVALYPATEPKDVRFHLYDRESGRRVRYRRVVDAEPTDARDIDERDGSGEDVEAADEPDAEVTRAQGTERRPGCDEGGAGGQREVEVVYDDLVRGVEVDPGQAVFLEPAEIEGARPQRSRMIDIEEFVDLGDIDPVYFEKSYYVAPGRDAGAEKPYALLLRALERRGRAGIGRFVLRTKPHLVAVRPMNGVIALETLFFGDEVRPAEPLVRRLERVEVRDRELELAEQLVEMLAAEWDPDRHADEYREELLRMIAEKTPSVVRHGEVEPSPEPSRVEELMEALRRSVEAVKEEQRESTPAARRRAR
jgi:DNA end-binding protein Ku